MSTRIGYFPDARRLLTNYSVSLICVRLLGCKKCIRNFACRATLNNTLNLSLFLLRNTSSNHPFLSIHLSATFRCKNLSLTAVDDVVDDKGEYLYRGNDPVHRQYFCVDIRAYSYCNSI